jgi:2-dehydro-3-deoxygluconokinase
MKKIITCGEAMGLFVADEVCSIEDAKHFTKYASGAEMNVAIGLARLGFESYYATKFGNDPLGKYIKKTLEDENIRTDYMYFSDTHTTGIQLKERVLEGDPNVVSYRKNSAASNFQKELIEHIDFSKFDYVHLSGVFLAISEHTKEISYHFAKEAKKGKAITTFDPNLRQKLWNSKEEMIETINDISKYCDIILPGIAEGFILTGYEAPEKIADFYLNKGAKCVIVKLGEQGAYLQEENSKGIYVEGVKVDKIVDTVGAGDAFAVGIISAIADGLTLQQAVERGNKIASLQLMTSGDNDGLPTRNELNNRNIKEM